MLRDFKVRVLDVGGGDGGAVRVLITLRGGAGVVWSTVGVDRNVVSAPVNALSDGYGMLRRERGRGGNGSERERYLWRTRAHPASFFVKHCRPLCETCVCPTSNTGSSIA